MNAEPGFFLVWSPQGVRPPSYRHQTLESAEAEATRLASENPGSDFIVLSSRSLFRVARVQRLDLVPKEIPF